MIAEEIRNGILGIHYKGDFRKLSRVLSTIFPYDNSEVKIIPFAGGENYFIGSCFQKGKHFWVQTPLKPKKLITEHEIYRLWGTGNLET